MKKYLEDLKKELKRNNISDDEIEEILNDHQEMITEAIAEGLSEEEIYGKFGNPKKVADDIAQMSNPIKTEVSPDRGETGLWKTFPVLDNSIKSEVKLVNEDIRYETGDTDRIKVYYFGKIKEDLYRVSYESGVFCLERKSGIDWSWRTNRDDVQFVVVYSKTTSLDELSHNSVSADVEMNGLTAKMVQLSSTSGDVKASRIVSETFKLSTVSGDQNLSLISADSMKLSVVSGDLKISQAIVDGEMWMNSVSGDMEIVDATANDAVVSTVSGDLKGTEFYPKTVRLSSVSGDIVIKNTDVSKHIKILSKKSTSGDIIIQSL